MADNNYTVGRGEVHFAPFKAGTKIPTGYRYLGNTPELSLTLESEKLDHVNSDRGIREKDASVTIEVTRSGSIVTDNIMIENIAMFLFGAAEKVSKLGGSVAAEALNDVIPGRMYQLGQSDTDPIGARSIAYPGNGATAFSVKKGATTLVAGIDYVLNPTRGLLTVLEGGSVVADDDLTVAYTAIASNYQRVISGSEPVNGAMKFITFNPVGAQFDWTFPWVSISPNGDLNLKGDEWQQLPYNFEILRKSGLEGVYVNGQPFSA